jgi:1-acyl-sn-glycerol-3-phosphate acyltransferase
MGLKNHMKYPRRRVARAVLRAVTGRLIRLLGDLEVVGVEHVPASGPVILAANHFNFVDPPLVLYTSPRMVEFIGGANRPNSPLWSRLIPQLWGFIRAYRGGFSRSTFKESLSVLAQGGVLGIFPEGGSWASLLRPARPGLAYIAEQSQASVVPISITGAEELLGGPRRPVKIEFHPAMAPPQVFGGGKARRAELDAYGDHVMAQIATGLPDPQRGKFSTDAQAREAALAVSDFPFHAEELRGG